MTVTLHHSPKITPPFRLKLVYFHYPTQHLFKDVEIKSQHRLCLRKNCHKKYNLIRETHIFVHKHVFVPITSTQECHNKKCVKTVKIGTTAIKPSVHYSIRDVINSTLF